MIGERQGALAGGEAGNGPSQPKSDGTANGFGAFPTGRAPEPGEIQCVRALIEVKLPRRTVDA